MVKQLALVVGLSLAVLIAKPAAATLVATPSAGLSQDVHVVSDAARRSRCAAFEQRNPGWVVRPDGLGILGLRGDVALATRPAVGPARVVTGAEAEAKARSFIVKNADSLGLTAAQAAAIPATTSPPLRAGRSAHDVMFRADLTQAGFSKLRSVERIFSVRAEVYGDGEVGAVSTSLRDVPNLSIRSTAGLPADDPRVLGQIVGRPFEQWERVGMLPNSYTTIYRTRLLPPITKADVERVTLVVDIEYAADHQTFTLAYAVDLVRGDDWLQYLVDADTGAILRKPAPLGTLLP